MSDNSMPVWDPFVRLFHWGLVIAFTLAYFSGEEAYVLHLWTGYVVLVLVALRLPWGFIGGRHARFTDFVVGPRRMSAYLQDVLHARYPSTVGHNPLGGWMILAMLMVLLVLALSGVALDAAENRAGPLGDTKLFRYGDIIETTHRWATNLALSLVVLHLLGVAVASRLGGQNLVWAMITGRKEQR